MADITRRTKRYPSDLTDEKWERIAPLMADPGRRGHPREVEFRKVVNALCYLVRSGYGWRMLPIHFEHWHTVYGWFREQVERETSPTAAVIDSQSIKAPHAKTRNYDSGKKVVGRKRHIAVDTNGRHIDVSQAMIFVAMGNNLMRRNAHTLFSKQDLTCSKTELRQKEKK